MAKSTEKIKQVNPHNELIKSLPDVDYIQNPILYSQICGNFSLMQTNIMLSLIASIKEKISDHIVEGKGLVGPLFTEEELKDDLVFRIPLMSLGVDTNQYKDVEAAGKAIIKLDCTYHHTDENGNRVKTTSNIFGDFTIPDDIDKNGNPRKRGYIELTMRGKIANQIFNTSNQYVEHIADIAKICHSPRTPRLYVYLSAWRKSKSEILLTYDAVKEYLGMLEYDKGHNKIVKDKCPRYALFHRDVLTPAQKELEKLAKQGKVEFYFTYEPKYPTKKTRGVNPSHLLFKLIPTSCIMDETEEIVIPTTGTEPKFDPELWTNLSALGREADETWWKTFGECCSINKIEDGCVTFNAPSTFVIEKWEEQIKNNDWLYIAISGVFKDIANKISYRVVHE